MRSILISLSITLIIQTPGLAQKTRISGQLKDSISRGFLANATITLLQQKDSALVSFSMSNDKGTFSLENVGYGDFRLIITHVNYHPLVKLLSVDSRKPMIDLGNIVMTDLTLVLPEVIVSNEVPPVTLIGDTVQYNAGSFKVQPNANVEELLKKFPGLRVEKDGTIKAQGEKVNKLLVDGKEFFGNDPKIATKNLPADIVDKVQVYNKQSDQAQLTGFDDGNSEKTINLKLKQDKKKGYFGTLSGAAGTEGRYQGRFNLNSFKGARQISAIATANNTNSDGFTLMDMLNFTGELNRMMRNSGGGGNISININTDETGGSVPGLAGNNTGINTIWAGGVNYNNLIGTRTDLTSNYFYNRYSPSLESNIQREYLLPDSSYFYRQQAKSNKTNDNHRLNLSADYQIDSFTSLKISPSFAYQKTSSTTNSRYATLSQQGATNNEGDSYNQTANEGFNFRTDLLFRRKFRRKGRTFSISLQSTINQANGSAILQSQNQFYDKLGNLILHDTLDQRNINDNTLNGYTGKLVYTEPIFRHSLLEFSYGKSGTHSVAGKTTYDFNSLTDRFDLFNDRLSNDYENKYGYNNGGIRIRKQAKKYNYSLGISWQAAELEGRITMVNKDSVIGKRFTDFLPNARFQYYFSKFKNLQVNYSTYTTQPTASQLQPVADNSDPLNIKLGNPQLKQEYTNFLQTNLFLVSPYRNRTLFAFFTLQQTRNKIVNADRIDTMGVKTTHPVNVNGVYQLSADINWSIPIHFLKAIFNIGSTMNYYNSKQFINDLENTINTLSLAPTLRFDIAASDKIQISLAGDWAFNRSSYSLQPAANTNYFSQHYETSIDWQLPSRFFFSTNFQYTVNSQRANGFNSKVPLWNAAISRQILKLNRAEIKFSVNDLLNQNIGVSRNTNQNYIEDSRTLTLRRFFLLSFTYNLTKSGLNRENSGGNMRIIRK